MHALDYFLKYVKFETTSNDDSLSCPSSDMEILLAKEIVKDLEFLGYNPHLDDNGYVYLYIKGNKQNSVPFGLCAHMDTSPDVSGYNVNPQIIKKYDGTKIILNNDVEISIEKYPALKAFIGDDIVTTDGKTLLGADDKAGIAQIMGLLVSIKEENLEHGDIYICFTPDEEIGRGVDKIDYSYFPVKYAYTVDGEFVDSIEYENFNAASVKVNIKGISIHPGAAKGKMVNASELALEFNSMLPKHKKPEYTSGYEGFNHLTSINSKTEEATLKYIVRNHSREEFESQKEEFGKIAKVLNEKYGFDAFEVHIEDSYYNMYDIIKDDLSVVNKAKEAIKKVGLTPTTSPIRGGTDGARLTYNGILTPNLGTGGINFHSKAEVLSINQLNTGVLILKEIVKQYLD